MLDPELRARVRDHVVEGARLQSQVEAWVVDRINRQLAKEGRPALEHVLFLTVPMDRDSMDWLVHEAATVDGKKVGSWNVRRAYVASFDTDVDLDDPEAVDDWYLEQAVEEDADGGALSFLRDRHLQATDGGYEGHYAYPSAAAVA